MNYGKEKANIHSSMRSVRKSCVDFLLKEIDANKYKTVLDFGCGPGIYLIELEKQSQKLQLIGVDPSDSMIKIAHEKVQTCTIIKGNHVHINLDDSTVDMIFMINVIHHVENIVMMFHEFNRILKESGDIYIFTESHKQIEEKNWLDYFEGAKKINLDRSYDIPFIVASAKTIGFNFHKETVMDDSINEISLKEFITLIENKAFSILHLISDESYIGGLKKLIKDSHKKKYIKRISKTVLCFKKQKHNDFQPRPVMQ